MPTGALDQTQFVFSIEMIRRAKLFPAAGAQISLSTMGKGDWQRRSREAPDLQVCESNSNKAHCESNQE